VRPSVTVSPFRIDVLDAAIETARHSGTISTVPIAPVYPSTENAFWPAYWL
jgi:hypothetical protein